jgi:beta-glucosidase
LTAAYYNNPNFEGEPALRRVDALIDFIWKDTTPLGGQWGEAFSVRWTGFLVPPASGVYKLGVNGFNNFNLYLDEELIVEYQNIHHPTIKSKDVELEAGRFYAIQLDLASRGLDPQAQLLWSRPDINYEIIALEVAKKAEVIVAVMGLSPGLEGEEMPVKVEGFAGGDRTDIKLPRPQKELLRQLHTLGKPIVLVLLNGSALAINWAAAHIPAIVEAWYPGQAGGAALADVLFGDYNPAGRLPVTYYKSLEDLPPFEDYQMEGRTYRYFRGEPLFAFGHGLSYTTFAYSDLQLSAKTISPHETLSVSLKVTNTGHCAGDEVVQLYIQQPQASIPRPIKELKAFKRVALNPGQTKTITFQFDAGQFGFYDRNADFVIEPGPIKVMVGASSVDIRLVEQFEIIGETTKIGGAKVYFSSISVS